jgi:hypothetical protein
MAICLFCVQECENLTDEHVFPAALGGVLIVKDGSCANCNNGCSKFEQALLQELAPIRLMLQIPDRYGKIPKTDAVALTADAEYKAKISGDGIMRMIPVKSEREGPDGRLETYYQFLTDDQKERLRAKALQRGQEFGEIGPGDPKQAEIHFGGDLMVIGSQGGLRTIAKIAYVGLAYKAGPKMALSNAFDEIRSYISEGRGAGMARTFVLEQFMAACQQGPHQHSIVIAGRNDRKRVDAIVRLFGGLCYFVTLSDHYEGADFCDTLIYDAYRQKIDGMLWSSEQAELLQTEDVANNTNTVWDDLEGFGRRFCEFLNAAIVSKLSKQPD